MRKYSRLSFALVGLLSVAIVAPVTATQDDKKEVKEKDIKRYLQEAEKRIKDDKLGEAGGLYLTVLGSFPERGDIRLLLARIHRDLGEVEHMAAAYALAVDHLEDPAEIGECYEGMTEGYLKGADYIKALEAGKKAIEANPQSAPAHIAVAMSMAKTGNLAEAAPMARKALTLAPDSAIAHSTLGEANMAEGNLDEAEASFRKALELDPATAESHAGLAEILFKKEDYQGAVASATKALELNDQLTRAYGTRGKANNLAGNRDAAYSDLAMAITVNADDPDANLAFAEVYHSQDNASMAESYYRKAVQLNPAFVTAYAPLAELLIGAGKTADAVTILQQGVGQSPDSAKLHYLLGVCQEQAKEMDPALASFEKAVSLDDTLADAHYHKGKLLREHSQDKPGAIAALEKALSLKADEPTYLTQYGVALYESQQVDRALETLEKVTAMPEYNDMLGVAYLGVALKDKQRFAEAAVHFERAVEAVPNWGLARWGLAWSAFGQIGKGCPCTPEDEALVQKLIQHSAKAAELGVSDPQLAERAEILGKGEKVR